MLYFRKFSSILILFVCALTLLVFDRSADACTNILVTKSASADGSVIITYA